MSLIEEWMQYLTKHLRGIKMRNDENQIIQQINSIDDNLEKLERNSNRNSDQVGLIWLTILGYIIYLEFIK
jgi:uncharacterized protein (UPF0305 family)